MKLVDSNLNNLPSGYSLYFDYRRNDVHTNFQRLQQEADGSILS